MKDQLATIILDNGSYKNIVSKAFVERLKLPTTPHPSPYHLGWVQQDGPRLLINQTCAITFAIGPFRDTVECDVSPLDCCDLLLGLLYQHQRNAPYDARRSTHQLLKDGKTYELTSTAKPLSRTATTQQLSLHKCLSITLLPLPINGNRFSTK